LIHQVITRRVARPSCLRALVLFLINHFRGRPCPLRRLTLMRFSKLYLVGAKGRKHNARSPRLCPVRDPQVVASGPFRRPRAAPLHQASIADGKDTGTHVRGCPGEPQGFYFHSTAGHPPGPVLMFVRGNRNPRTSRFGPAFLLPSGSFQRPLKPCPYPGSLLKHALVPPANEFLLRRSVPSPPA
jgi:hypothetical protein